MNYTKLINDWEKEYNIFEICRIDDFEFYPYIRRDFINNLIAALNNEKQDYFSDGGEGENQVKLFLRLMKRSEKTSLKNVDLLILNHPRRIKGENGLYYCPFTDFLTDMYPNSISLERCYVNHTHIEPAYTKNLIYVDRAMALSYMYRVLSEKFKPGKYRAIRKRAEEILDKPLDTLSASLDVSIKKKALYERITAIYYFYRVRRKIYLKLLKQLKPKAIVEVIGRSVDAKLINELAKDLKIPTVEIQHSIMIPPSIYPDGVHEKQYVDYAFTYSEYWNEYVNPPIPKENFFAVGQPHFENQLAKYKDKIHRDKNRITIVFISGLVYGHDLSVLAVNLRKLTDPEKINIIYKLHPIEFSTWKEMYPELAASSVTVLDTTEKGVYDVFAESNAQIGVKSTALYEGIGFGLKTFIYDHPLAEEMEQVYKGRYATLVKTAEELLAALEKEDDGKEASSTSIAEHFWKPNAKENVKRLLDELIKNGKIETKKERQ
ncbi:MAG: hypothetical protein K6F99_06935 [Lachnospiraceae bacterium]|nr:hypothetical protein [Lachnospiraceae bacterium]